MLGKPLPASSLPQRDLLQTPGDQQGVMKLTNIANTAYMGELYFGAPLSQKITNIIFDTGSDVLAIMSATCQNCPAEDEATGHYYNRVDSKASVQRESGVNETYGSAAIQGMVVNDTVCLGHIDLREQLEEVTDHYDEDDAELLELDGEDLMELQEQEFEDVIQLVETEKSCISQFPFLAVE